ERDVRSAGTKCSKLICFLFPSGRYSVFDALENTLGGDSIELHIAARWQKWKPIGYLISHMRSRAAEQRLEPAVVAKLLAVLTDKIQNSAKTLSWCLAKTAAKLLQEEE